MSSNDLTIAFEFFFIIKKFCSLTLLLNQHGRTFMGCKSASNCLTMKMHNFETFKPTFIQFLKVVVTLYLLSAVNLTVSTFALLTGTILDPKLIYYIMNRIFKKKSTINQFVFLQKMILGGKFQKFEFLYQLILTLGRVLRTFVLQRDSILYAAELTVLDKSFEILITLLN